MPYSRYEFVDILAFEVGDDAEEQLGRRESAWPRIADLASFEKPCRSSISFEAQKSASREQTHAMNCSMDDSTGCVFSVRRNEDSPGVIKTVVDGILELDKAF